MPNQMNASKRRQKLLQNGWGGGLKYHQTLSNVALLIAYILPSQAIQLFQLIKL